MVYIACTTADFSSYTFHPDYRYRNCKINLDIIKKKCKENGILKNQFFFGLDFSFYCGKFYKKLSTLFSIQGIKITKKFIFND